MHYFFNQVLYEYVFSSRNEDQPFTIFECFPHKVVVCSREQTICEAQLQGLLAVSDGAHAEATDPILLLNDSSEVSGG